MSAQRRGLGRGLGALLGESAVPTSTSQEFVREIPVADITPNPFQPRKTFDPGALDDLKSSIAEYGVLVPIIVRRQGDKFELVAGERRWRACAALGKGTIPAIVRASDDRQTLEFAIVENLQRENLNPLEEAAGFAYLIEEHGLTQEEVARRLGKSRPVIANTLRLLALSDAIKAMLAGGALSAGHARALLTVPEDQRLVLAQRAVSSGLTVRALEELAATAGPPRTARPKAAPASQELSPDETAFVTRLRERFGTGVELVRDRRGGRIELRFASDEELARIGDLLLE